MRDPEGKAFSAALGRYRRGSDIGLAGLFPGLDPAELNQTFLGMNAVVVSRGSGEVKLADRVEIVEMR